LESSALFTELSHKLPSSTIQNVREVSLSGCIPQSQHTIDTTFNENVAAAFFSRLQIQFLGERFGNATLTANYTTYPFDHDPKWRHGYAPDTAGISRQATAKTGGEHSATDARSAEAAEAWSVLRPGTAE